MTFEEGKIEAQKLREACGDDTSTRNMLPLELVKRLSEEMKDEVRIAVPKRYKDLDDIILENYMYCFDDTKEFWSMVSLKARISNTFMKKYADKLNPFLLKVVNDARRQYKNMSPIMPPRAAKRKPKNK